MRESFGGTGLFMIVMFFIVLFAGYLCLSINQTRAFNVKNAIIRVVERYGANNGITNAGDLAGITGFSTDIEKELSDAGYRTVGNCGRLPGTGWVGFDANGNVARSGNTVFCIKYVSASASAPNNPTKNLHYFKVATFYHFNIPALNLGLNLNIQGDTKVMM